MTSCIGFLISMFGTRTCGQTLLFIVIANCAIHIMRESNADVCLGQFCLQLSESIALAKTSLGALRREFQQTTITILAATVETNHVVVYCGCYADSWCNSERCSSDQRRVCRAVCRHAVSDSVQRPRRDQTQAGIHRVGTSVNVR